MRLTFKAAPAIFATLLCASLPARAELQYYPDPAHKKLAPDEPMPMDDMVDLAKDGDPRAEFILGDLYQKGKGGLEKNLKESHHWFELSAMHGYGQAFVRLAAQAKHAGDTQLAWQWYTLAIDALDGAAQDYAIQARRDLQEQSKISREDMDAARKSMREWKDLRDKTLRELKDSAGKSGDDTAKSSAGHDSNPQQDRNLFHE